MSMMTQQRDWQRWVDVAKKMKLSQTALWSQLQMEEVIQRGTQPQPEAEVDDEKNSGPAKWGFIVLYILLKSLILGLRPE